MKQWRVCWRWRIPLAANLLAAFIISFLGGVAAGLLSANNHWLEISWLLVGWLLLLFLYRGQKTNFTAQQGDLKNKSILKQENFNRDFWWALFLFWLIIGLGWWWGGQRAQSALEQAADWLPGEFQGEGVVVSFPEDRQTYQKIVFRITGQKKLSTGTIKKEPEKILVFAPIGPKFNYGEVYTLKCRLNNPDFQEGRFNYRRFLAARRIYQTCSWPQLIKQADQPNNLSFWEQGKIILYRLAQKTTTKIENKIANIFPFPESAYLAGLFLGGDKRLPNWLAEDFRRTGTTHTIAVSGSNIALIAFFLLEAGILVGLWRQQAFYLVLLGIVFFIIMIGAPASAVRAGIMGGLIFLAWQKGRLASGWRALLLAAFLMVVVNPFLLLYDVGFQLSFLATLGIIMFLPLFQKLWPGNSNGQGLLTLTILTTLAAQLGVAGLIWFVFQNFSPVSLLANLIIPLFIPLIMAGGALAIFLSLVAPGLLVWLVAAPTILLLTMELKVISWLSVAPLISQTEHPVSLFFLVGYYFLLFGFWMIIFCSYR